MGKDTLVHSSGQVVLTDPGKCSGCGRCVAACPERLYTLELRGRRKQALNRAPEKCAACGKCILACPLDLLADKVSLRPENID